MSASASDRCAATHRIGGQLVNHEVCVLTLGGETIVAAKGDRAVAALASRQHGVVSYAQLLVAGVSRRAIERRVEAGRLHRVHRRVYAVGHTADAPLVRETAALLACGSHAVLSHRSAGAVWGLVEPPVRGVDVTVVGSDCGVRPGIRLRRARHLAAVDTRMHAGLRVTAPARTLIDLASVSSTRGLRRAVNEALVLRLADEDDLWAALDRARGRRGVPKPRRLLVDARGPSLTRSEAERRLLDLLSAAGLPMPRTNVKLGRFEVDFLWRTERLVVEVDGYAFHGTRAAFERDRVRDAELQAGGLTVVRVTWRQIVDAPEATVARIARLIGQRAAGPVVSGTA